MKHKFTIKAVAAILTLLTVAALITSQALSKSGSMSDPQGSLQQTTTPTKIQRNLALYKQAMPLNIPDNIAPVARAAAMSQVRSFLWQHWQSKQRAKASYIATILQGYAPGATSFYVEPDEQGKWRIALEVQGNDYPQHFYFIEQIFAPSDGHPDVERSAGQGGQRSDSFKLHLKPSAEVGYGMVF